MTDEEEHMLYHQAHQKEFELLVHERFQQQLLTDKKDGQFVFVFPIEMYRENIDDGSKLTISITNQAPPELSFLSCSIRETSNGAYMVMKFATVK